MWRKEEISSVGLKPSCARRGGKNLVIVSKKRGGVELRELEKSKRERTKVLTGEREKGVLISPRGRSSILN